MSCAGGMSQIVVSEDPVFFQGAVFLKFPKLQCQLLHIKEPSFSEKRKGRLFDMHCFFSEIPAPEEKKERFLPKKCSRRLLPLKIRNDARHENG